MGQEVTLQRDLLAISAYSYKAFCQRTLDALLGREIDQIRKTISDATFNPIAVNFVRSGEELSVSHHWL